MLTVKNNIIFAFVKKTDPFFFSDQDVSRSWLWEDIGNYFGAAASGILVFYHTFEIIFNTPHENLSLMIRCGMFLILIKPFNFLK